MFRLCYVLFLPLMLLVVGCAANSSKKFDKKLARLDSKSVVLATVTSDNKLDKTDKLQPGRFVMKKAGESKKKYNLYASKHFRLFTENKKYCLIVLEVDEGDHYISTVDGVVLGDVFLPVFDAQVKHSFTANNNEIIYIGNIHMILRKKTSESEDSAGDHLLPGRIIDQAAIAGTTIDVEINDEYERDMNQFVENFPNLKGYTVVKRILQHHQSPGND